MRHKNYLHLNLTSIKFVFSIKPIQICNENLPYIANGLLLTGPLTINYRFSRLACELRSIATIPYGVNQSVKHLSQEKVDYFLYFTQKQLLLSHPQMAANTLALREENDEKLFHLLAAVAARDFDEDL